MIAIEYAEVINQIRKMAFKLNIKTVEKASEQLSRRQGPRTFT